MYLNRCLKPLFKYIFFIGGDYLDALANFIVKHKKLIIFLYLILSLLAFIGSRFVEVNYDLSLYLPKDLNSIKGKNILEEEFGIGGTAYILIKDESLNEIEI